MCSMSSVTLALGPCVEAHAAKAVTKRRRKLVGVLEVEALERVEDPIQLMQTVPALALFHHPSSSRGRAGDDPTPSLARRPIIWFALLAGVGAGSQLSGELAVSFYPKVAP